MNWWNVEQHLGVFTDYTNPKMVHSTATAVSNVDSKDLKTLWLNLESPITSQSVVDNMFKLKLLNRMQSIQL